MTNSLKSFDRVAHCYDETRGLPDEVAREVGDGIAAILREVSDAPRVLECGIGTGRIAVPLAAAGVRVAGIDISAKMLSVLREKRGGGAIRGDSALRPDEGEVIEPAADMPTPAEEAAARDSPGRCGRGLPATARTRRGTTDWRCGPRRPRGDWPPGGRRRLPRHCPPRGRSERASPR